ncbi:MAG: pyrroline-5-carboxylate reductase, partial [Nanoarchaeota archaeon]|nr:pyrroline-5-carboxylate reductase [Nanoarchaeota archaeon]
CIVGKMAAGLAVNEFCKIEDVELVRKILESSGKVYTLEEPLLDAVTGLSGSGPAYVARLIQWFSQAGIAQGLPEDVSYGLALQTFIGTVKLLSEKGLSPQALIDQVSSPNGTTVAGMAVLENSDIPQVLSDSVKEATNRSKELGK